MHRSRIPIQPSPKVRQPAGFVWGIEYETDATR